MKGQKWYQAEPIAEAYEDKRFTGGGRLIDEREKQALIDALAPVEGKEILEIACGTGRLSVMLAEHDAKVTGIDISEAMLSQGREKARSVSVTRQLEFLRGDAARLPFPDNSFDCVFAIRFFHLTDAPERFLAEMRRVTRDTVFFDTFNSFSARSVYNWLLPMGSRLYSRSEVLRLLRSVGLQLHDSIHDFIVPYGIYRSLPDGAAQPIRAIDSRLLNTPLGYRLATVSFWNTVARYD